MENKENLPWELILEILSHVPPKSLVRFRTISKQWNTIISDKAFIKNNKTTFQFILATKSKIYGVRVNPKIEVTELTLDIPALESQSPRQLISCEGLLLCSVGKGAVVWNPYLGQTRWIDPESNHPIIKFYGIGYDYDCRYKTLASYKKYWAPLTRTFWKTHDFSSDGWNDLHTMVLISGGSNSSTQKGGSITFRTTCGVSLNGTWYRIASYDKTKYLFFLIYFDFSMEAFYKFCDLPCDDNHAQDTLVVGVFKGGRFSLLKQSHLTKKIQIWVTKNEIHKRGGENVEWINFMEVSAPNLPTLVQTRSYSQPSFFIDDKRLVVCSCDETGRAWIYVVGNNNLISKTKIELVVDLWPLHCSFTPSLVSVPRGRKGEEHNYKFN
ncbi:hypothetical protein Bca4012_063121 [Brassica carinata]|uniref:F-box domain-containing protein n=1 Tax=Brassica carinata TaxID=52824 RepID=A0A8X7SD68_BRACI|nr:hypothetical protein Bca52824_032862 [Brassica carinata]